VVRGVGVAQAGGGARLTRTAGEPPSVLPPKTMLGVRKLDHE
jgi:hypothetical protein